MEFKSGYYPKDLHFDQEAQKSLLSGISKMARAVGSTLGAHGRTVLIESPEHTHGIAITKDGVTVARSINLPHPIENLAVNILRQAADRTALAAGDGTTTSIVLADELVSMGMSLITEGMNRTVALRHIQEYTSQIVKELRKDAIRVTKRRLVDVATISANGDKRIGKLIASTYNKVGYNGIVLVDKSDTYETYAETVSGLRIDRGYSSPLFINDRRRDECVMSNANVLVCDTEISNVMQLENVLRHVMSKGEFLLVIAPCSQNALNTFAANVVKVGLKVCVIQPPSFGYKQHELMQDIALSVGAKYFSEKTGDDLSLIKPSDLGRAERVTVSSDKTIVLPSELDPGVKHDIETRVKELREAYRLATKKHEKDFISQRIASLSGGIGIIFVGGTTDIEQKELYDRVDDAVCAVRSAIEEGVVAGGGVALVNAVSKVYCSGEYHTKEEQAAIQTLRQALTMPMRTICANAGINVYDLDDEPFLMLHGVGVNVKSGRLANMIEDGIIDPLKVTRSALENAVSVAVTILSTNAIITMARAYEGDR